MAEIDESTTLAAQVFASLRADLKANRFKPGERLHFEKMRAIYDVGVAPLREALSRLSESGLVVQVGQKGFRVAPASLEDLQDVIETRRFLEVRIFQEAVRHGDEAWEASLVGAFHRFSKVSRQKPANAEERTAWEEQHTNFHRVLMAGCPNRWLLHLWSIVFDQAERYRRLAFEVGHWSDDELGDHERLLEAALARDSTQAGQLLHQHIGVSAERLIAQISRDLIAASAGEEDRGGARRRRVAALPAIDGDRT
jgi:DNA-binding GntR family transcriptional regulator